MPPALSVMTSGVRRLTSSVRMDVSASGCWFWTTLMSGFSASNSAMICSKSASASPLNWKKFSVVWPGDVDAGEHAVSATPARVSAATAPIVARAAGRGRQRDPVVVLFIPYASLHVGSRGDDVWLLGSGFNSMTMKSPVSTVGRAAARRRRRIGG